MFSTFINNVITYIINRIFFIVKYPFFIFGIILIFSCNSCDPLGIEDRCERDYSFSIPVTMSPALDTFHVGDTIHINMEFPVEMEDQSSGEFFDMSDFPFDLEIAMAWLSYDPIVSAEIDFQFIERIGKITKIPITSELAINLDPELSDNTFLMEFDIVLDSIGLTGFSFNNREPLTGYPSSIEPDCRINSIDFSFSTNNQEDNNFEFLQYSEDPKKQNLTKDFFDSSGSYLFFVTE